MRLWEHSLVNMGFVFILYRVFRDFTPFVQLHCVCESTLWLIWRSYSAETGMSMFTDPEPWRRCHTIQNVPRIYSICAFTLRQWEHSSDYYGVRIQQRQGVHVYWPRAMKPLSYYTGCSTHSFHLCIYSTSVRAVLFILAPVFSRASDF
jgi:hypothetical protein